MSDALLGELYRRCSGLLVASSLERFCIPVLEALAARKPVFTSADTAFFSEVFGDAVQPILTFDGAGAKALAMAGREKLAAAYDAVRERLLVTYGMANFSRLVTVSLKEMKAGAPI